MLDRFHLSPETWAQRAPIKDNCALCEMRALRFCQMTTVLKRAGVLSHPTTNSRWVISRFSVPVPLPQTPNRARGRTLPITDRRWDLILAANPVQGYLGASNARPEAAVRVHWLVSLSGTIHFPRQA